MSRRTKYVLIAVLSVVVATVLQLLRQRGVHSWETVLGEDGTVFYSEYLRDGVDALFSSYAGYYMLSSRLLIVPATWLPIECLPVYAAVVGSLITSLLALAVYRLSGSAIPSRPLRIILAVAACLHPTMVFAIQASITNLLWPLIFACFWAVASDRRTRIDVVLRVGIAFVAAASTVLTAFFWPLAAFLAWRRRDRPSILTFGALSTGLLIQVIAVITTTGATKRPSSFGDLPDLYANRVLGPALFGEHWTEKLWLRMGTSLGVVAVLIVGVGVTLLFLSTARHARFLGSVAVGYSVVIFCAAVYWRGTDFIALDPAVWRHTNERLVTLGIWLLLSGVFIFVAGVAAGRLRDVLVALAVAQLVFVMVYPLTYENGRSRGPSWSDALDEATERCERDPTIKTLGVQASPSPIWKVAIPCRELVDR
jgi:hypothetical protein